MFPERFSTLPEYPFPRLRSLLADLEPGGPMVSMSIGEPKHAPPAWVSDVIAEAAEGFRRYPPNEGSQDLREAIAGWLKRRYDVALDPGSQILPLNGTREGLFNAGLALGVSGSTVLIPNPFYQAYAAAALAVDARPVYMPAPAETGFLPDFESVSEVDRAAASMIYFCTPSNPQGAVATLDDWARIFAFAEDCDAWLLVDECYSEIYRDTPPIGALEAAAKLGVDTDRILIFHSLSKRSNLPGLRSGFVAGPADAIARLKQVRAYGGAPLPLPLQAVAARAWADEEHVEASRARYQTKYELADQILGNIAGYRAPTAGFFLWVPVADDEAITRDLWTQDGIRVLPGRYLTREDGGSNRGQNYIRVALVADEDDISRGLEAIRAKLTTNGRGK
ncbi:MAG: aminotransferase class I/II-fold pyridoxal phosphate-dependent enzyme [Pseudomonadota bacterium]